MFTQNEKTPAGDRGQKGEAQNAVKSNDTTAKYGGRSTKKVSLSHEEVKQILEMTNGTIGENRVTCIQCGKGNFGVNTETGAFQCFNCEIRGNLYGRPQQSRLSTAEYLWEQGKPAQDHPYLKDKNVKSYGLRVDKHGNLLVPLSIDGQITTLQFIRPDGSKILLSKEKGGRKKGASFRIGHGAGTIYVGEGYATMAAVYEPTGGTCYMAIDAGNLLPVAKMLRRRYPESEIVFCADNDRGKAEADPGYDVGHQKAIAAAKAVGGFVCMPKQPGHDFNDLYREQGVDAVRQCLADAQYYSADSQQQAPPEKWAEPIPLDEPEPVRINPDALPPAVGDMIRAVSEFSETPLELPAGLSLPVLSTCLQGKIVIEVKSGYREPLNTMVATLLPPAHRKSSVHTLMTAPITAWERQKAQELAEEIRETESIRKNQDARLKALRQRYGKALLEELPEIEAEILEIEKNLVEPVQAPQVWAQDVTPEHLGTLMSKHNGKMSILSTEGGIFEIIAGRYSGGIPNLDLFLQAHAGDPVRVDRGSREPVFLDSPCLSMGLTPQPEVGRGLAGKPGFRGRGLLARILYLLPPSQLGHRTLETPSIPPAVESAYRNLVSSLLDIEPGTDEQNRPTPHVLHLSREAYAEWLDFARVVERDLQEGGRFEYIRDWAGKLPGASARIAGLLHCVENPIQPWAAHVAVDTLSRALEIASVFASHALLAFDLMGADKSLDGARKVWRWVERTRAEKFSKRECFRALRGSFSRAAEIEEPLKILIERNYIRERTDSSTGGRPSIQYDVNPIIVEGWS